MLTPQFKINQNQDHIIVMIRVPYVKISACEFYIEQYNFKFYLKPYLLNLSFEHPLLQVQQPSKATYYHQKHLLQVHIKKKNKDEHFENLNLLSKILNKNKQKDKTKKHHKTLIQVIDQPSLVVLNQNIKKNMYGYGFCNNYCKIFNQLQEQCYELFSLNPQQVSRQDRVKLSIQICQSVFDQQAYLYDKYQNQQDIQRILQNDQIIVGIKNLLNKYNSKQPLSYEQFKSQLKIPNKQIIVDKIDQQNIIKQLFSICFSYLYELVCMQGDMSVQSAKTINNCSSVFNCCVDYAQYSILEIVKDCCKRFLSYSLYKNVKLCNKTILLLTQYLDQTFLCAVLANLRNMFQKSEPRYLLNTIFLNDYLIYCFKQNINGQLQKIKEELKKIDCSQAFLNLQFEQQDDQIPEQQDQLQNKQKSSQEDKKVLVQQIMEKGIEKGENSHNK